MIWLSVGVIADSTSLPLDDLQPRGALPSFLSPLTLPDLKAFFFSAEGRQNRTPLVANVLRPNHGAEQTPLQRVSAGSFLFYAFFPFVLTSQSTHFLVGSFQLQSTLCSRQPLCAMAEGTGGCETGWFAGRAEEEGESVAKAHGWRRQESRREEGGQRRGRRWFRMGKQGGQARQWRRAVISESAATGGSRGFVA